jgi:protein-S-isoprenylcysteine O-methyltransferase Ste14
MRWGGVMGCWLPAWLARWGSLDVRLLLLFRVESLYVLLVGVREEEDMLRSEFGEEFSLEKRHVFGGELKMEF